MRRTRSSEPEPQRPVSTTARPTLAQDSLYVGVDVGKRAHVAGFVSRTLLARHGRFEGCPVVTFANSRAGFQALRERLLTYTPLEQVTVLLEQTGHYHAPLVHYLLELDLAVYLIHIQTRPAGLLKTDKRDALRLANQLYSQLELGAQVADQRVLVRRAIAPTSAAALLRSLMRHRYELVRETTRRKNQLTAIADELFPELVEVFHDPNARVALRYRETFPTPDALAAASVERLTALRSTGHPSLEQLAQLQALAQQTIGVRDPARARGLVLEQAQLIAELRLVQTHLAELDEEVRRVVADAREGRILTSIPGIGPIQAAAMLAAIGHIDNFASAAALKAYFGWAPQVRQSGQTLDRVQQTRAGTRPMKQMMFLVVCHAIQQPQSEWARLYARLVPKKCRFDERTQRYTGRLAVLGRIAGQMIGTLYALLKRDAETLARLPAGAPLPEPALYDPAVHRAHIEGHYRSSKPRQRPQTLVALPKPIATP